MNSCHERENVAELEADFRDDGAMNDWQRCPFPDSFVKSKVRKKIRFLKRILLSLVSFRLLIRVRDLSLVTAMPRTS